MLRAVIADDEETIRNGLKRLIDSFDMGLCVVATAQDGQEALAAIREYRPEIILMDVNMPLMNGLEVIAEVRKLDDEAKIIIISGYSQFEYAQKALTLGVSNYLLKPVDYRTLRDILQKAMDAYSGRFAQKSKLREDATPEQEETCKDLGLLAVAYIKENFADNAISLGSVAQRFYTSQSNLTKVIKQKTGFSFTDYLNHLRINQAVLLLQEREHAYTINDISERVGYSSQHYFSRAFKNYKGVSPNKFRGGLATER